MPYGWMGRNLEIDLTQGSVERTEGDAGLVRDYLGGKGMGIKILWDRLPPETVKAYSPDNLIVISNGLLTGTNFPATNRCVMSFISPLTDLYSHSAIGGSWAPMLKFAGYDNIVIRGKSPTPVYLWINNDRVELRKANQLWGKGTFETRSLIRQELKNNKVEIACIGPAGENRVHAAAVMCGIGSSFSRGGTGALWGDKKLKAIAVYGTRDVNVAHPTRVNELCTYTMNRSDNNRNVKEEWTSRIPYGTETTNVWYGYFGESERDQLPPELQKEVNKVEERWSDLVARKGLRSVACFNCLTPCRLGFDYKGGLNALKCSSLLTFIVYSKYFDLDFALDCYNWNEDMGLDVLAIGRYAAFAIHLYQQGILNKSDTDGMHLEYGNPELFKTLMEKIVRREGIGDILAQGTQKAARQIGRGAEEHVHVHRGQELRLTAKKNYAPVSALNIAVDDRGDNGGYFFNGISGWTLLPSNPFSSREGREAHIKNGWFKWPPEYEKYFLAGTSRDGNDYEPGCQLLAYSDEGLQLYDSCGFCTRTTAFSSCDPVTSRAKLADIISATTGMDIDEAEATRIANRILNLSRVYTRRFGLTRKDDTVPDIYFEQEPLPPFNKLRHEVFDKWVSRYYELRGWDNEGMPTKETLEKVGLGYVWEWLKNK